MQNLQQVRYVTSNYHYLQGLRLVPFALFAIAQGALGGDWLDTPDWLHGWIPFAIGLALAFLGYRMIGTYYDRTFGHVERAPGAGARDNRALAIFFLIYIASAVIDASVRPRVSISELVLACGILAYWWPRRRFATHYLMGALIVIAVSLLPLLGITPTMQIFRSGVEMVTIGMVALFIGLLDHLLLVNTLRWRKEATDDQSI